MLPSPEILHTALELLCVLLCVGIASDAFNRYQEMGSGFHFLWGAGFALVAFSDMIHGLLSLGVHSLIQYWVPLTWGLGRVVLLVFLCAGGLLAATPLSRRWGYTLAGIGAVVVVAIMFGSLYLGQTWVVGETLGVFLPFIHRPLDLILMFGYLAAWGFFTWTPAIRVQVPPGLHFFMILAVMTHGVMALGSSQPLDESFNLAHLLKACEYGVWAAGLCWERSLGHNGVRELVRAKEHSLGLTEAAYAKLELSLSKITQRAKRR